MVLLKLSLIWLLKLHHYMLGKTVCRGRTYGEGLKVASIKDTIRVMDF